MTGTSLDGIDAAAVQLHGHGLELQATLIHHAASPLGAAAAGLRELACGKPVTAEQIAATGHQLSIATADSMQKAMHGDRADLAGVHGQTVLHRPPMSWQLIDAAIISERLACPVASHFRGGDLAAGGQGAPITPLADWVLFRSHVPRAIVNLGGFCNITFLPGSNDLADVTGRDVCVCNQLLDAAAAARLGTPFDVDGAAAAAGTPDPDLVQSLNAAHARTSANHRSLGTGDESFDWLQQHDVQQADTPCLLATIVESIAARIAAAILATSTQEVIVAGGGARHQGLLEAISARTGLPTVCSTDHGIPVEAREAACIAILAALDADGVPTTIPAVTGRRDGVVPSVQWCRPLGISP